MSKNPELAIFDLDGTLIHFHQEYLFQQADKMLEHLECAPVMRLHIEEAFSAFDFFRFVEESIREKFKRVFWERFDWENFPEAQVIEGSLIALENLKQRGVAIALATSRIVTVEELNKELSETGLLEFFDHIETRESDDVHWTDKTGHLTEVCRVLGVAAERALMVGDIPADIESAKRVGMGKTAAVLSGGIREDVLRAENPDHILSDVSQVLEIIYRTK